VLNIVHHESEFGEVTAMQERELFPVLRSLLDGRERIGLDFGAGPGRFSVQLSEIIRGRIIAADPTPELLCSGPKSPSVEYRLLKNDTIPLDNGTVDLVWICLVLGGIPDRTLPAWIKEIDRVLRPNGLVFLVENTADKAGSPLWIFRPVGEYLRLFDTLAGITLAHLHNYFDAGERTSVMAGRKGIAQTDRSEPGNSRRALRGRRREVLEVPEK
jgi:SAM-dependent methyltransferase